MQLLQGGARIPVPALYCQSPHSRAQGTASHKNRRDPLGREWEEYCRGKELKDEKRVGINVQVEAFNP